MDPRARSAGLRLFQSFDSHRQARRLFDLSRSHRRNAGRLADAIVADGMVPGLPPASRERDSRKEGRRFRYELESTGDSINCRGTGAGKEKQDSGSECFDQLFDLSSMSNCMRHEVSTTRVSGSVNEVSRSWRA